MHDQGSCPGPQSRSRLDLAHADDALQLALLTQVLALHPAQLSLAELARELSETPEDFGERDTVEQAVRDLVRTGLLRRDGESVLPSRTVLRFEELANG
jgi:DNA-binding IclR family transcriptional regulator